MINVACAILGVRFQFQATHFHGVLAQLDTHRISKFILTPTVADRGLKLYVTSVQVVNKSTLLVLISCIFIGYCTV